MKVYPTRSTFHVAVLGIGLLALGAAARIPAIASFGSAVVLAVAIGRAASRVSIARLRTAGLEMVWTESVRVHRASRGTPIVLRAELRNRSDQPARACAVRAIGSSLLDLRVLTPVIDLPALSAAPLELEVTPHRAGRFGVHGIALELRPTPFGTEGLYEAPLLFANPIGIEALPAPLAARMMTARGGRGRRAADVGRSGPVAGVGDELRELRDHLPGDPFKRIAWKASARRGRLLVRDMDREERGVVWLLVDVSVELWAGVPGSAPLDRVIDHVGAIAGHHLAHGDRVGLVVTASRVRTAIHPASGPGHSAAIASALAEASSFADADRCELDEAEVARIVFEHARPLDAQGLVDVPRHDLDTLAQRADKIRQTSAPFAPATAHANAPRERALRTYLNAFGIESPPRVLGERDKTAAEVTQTLERLAAKRPHASMVHVWAPPPVRGSPMAAAVSMLRRRGTEVRWTIPPFEAAIGEDRARRSALADVIDDAVRLRARATREIGERTLRKLGARLLGPAEDGRR